MIKHEQIHNPSFFTLSKQKYPEEISPIIKNIIVTRLQCELRNWLWLYTKENIRDFDIEYMGENAWEY